MSMSINENVKKINSHIFQNSIFRGNRGTVGHGAQ